MTKHKVARRCLSPEVKRIKLDFSEDVRKMLLTPEKKPRNMIWGRPHQVASFDLLNKDI